MQQDVFTGARANEYGRDCAKRIAEHIGAEPVTDNSNEFALAGTLVTIRCARSATTKVGVTYTMLDRIDMIIAAFESEPNSYELFEMTPALYKLFMEDSKEENKVGLVTRSNFRKHGKHRQSVHI